MVAFLFITPAVMDSWFGEESTVGREDDKAPLTQPLATLRAKPTSEPHQSVQRCRTHKLRNVLDYLPKVQRAQARSVLRAAWKLPAKEGMARVQKLAARLDQQYPSAAASLMEGLEECFTINRLDLPPSLHRCLATTNIIESPRAGVRIQTRRVTHQQNGQMVQRWMASASIRTEKRFNKIMGHRDLWALKSYPQPRCDRQPEGGVVTST
jgi:transposase-like protein